MPALLELLKQSSGPPQGNRVADHALGAAVLPLRHQARALQDGYVLLDGGKRHVVVRGEFAHRRLSVHDPRQDVATRGIGERPEQLVQVVRHSVPTYNHLVVDNSTAERLPVRSESSSRRADRRHVPTGLTGVSGSRPCRTSITFRTARSIIAVRVSRVALPRWGASTTFSIVSSAS